MFSFVPELPLPPPPLFEQLVPKRQFKRPSKAETKRNAKSYNGSQKCWMTGGKHIIQPEKQFKICNICIFEEIDSFY